MRPFPARLTRPTVNDAAMPDAEILAGFLRGEPRAVHHVQGWIDGVVYLGRWNFEDPESVTQEVLLKLLRIGERGGFRGRSTFKTFVFSVAKHTCVDIYRRERLRGDHRVHAGDVEGRAVDRDPQDALERRERLELVRYIFQRLPEECRRLWRWTYREGLSATEIGARLEISPGNARVRVHRCLERARSLGRIFAGGIATGGGHAA